MTTASLVRRLPARARAEPARVDTRLLIALVLAVAVHGALLLAGSFRGTYDAYVHIFFADHYARDWFSTWDTRWYTGFTVTSYPPGAHMLVAMASGLVGLELGFVVVQLGAVVLLVIGVFRFSRIWVSTRAAGWAAILAALSPVLGLVVHVFGQLPTTVGLAFTLNALPSAYRWVLDGGWRNLATAVGASAAATAAHHVTTLFGVVFFVGPVVVAALLRQLRTALPEEPAGHPGRITRDNLWPLVARRVRRVLPGLLRSAVYGGLLLVGLVLVVLPYWLWSSADPIVQIPIPHASRDSFLANPNAGLVFWLVPWGAVLLAWPVAVVRGFRSTAWPLAASIVLLTVLGLGGTTPVARTLTRSAFDILTFDRFTVWAAVAILPLVGAVIDSALTGPARARLDGWLERPVQLVGAGLAIVALVASFLFAATLTRFRPFQPDPIDPEPIAAFLAKDDHDSWRYLALGFGDQMAWLSANTTAATVDGNYHSARRLPELVTRPVERLEGAKYRGIPGIGSLQQFLAVPERYHLKFAFSNDRFYDPLLHFSGWQRVGTLENGIEVWERADVPPLPAVLPTKELPTWQRLSWGLLPPGALVVAAVLLAWQALRPAGPGRRRVPVGLRRVDARLGRLSSRLAAVGETPRSWHVWRPALTAFGARLEGLRGRLARRLVSVAAVAVIGLPVVVLAGLSTEPASVADVVTAYHSALDERRFDDAHALLDPQQRPGLDAFALGISVDGGGLQASYSMLDAVTVVEVARGRTGGADTVDVEATLRLVTALTEYDVVVTHRLVQRDGTWTLAPPERPAATPEVAFLRRPAVDYLATERRRVTTGRTLFSDVLDRPELAVRSARLIRVDGRHVVVGEVVNLDVDPADLTVTGILRGPDGEEWASYNAQQATLHTLPPGASTPFRIEFEGVAGATAAAELAEGGFDPEEYSPPTLPVGAVVTGFDVYAKAVVTPRNLDRVLGSYDVTADVTGRGIVVRGTARNHGTVEAAIPHVLVTGLDAEGEVVWVEHRYLPASIRPQQEAGFEVVLPPPDGLVVVDRFGRRFDNGLASGGGFASTAGVVPVIGGGEVVAVRVDLDAYIREET